MQVKYLKPGRVLVMAAVGLLAGCAQPIRTVNLSPAPLPIAMNLAPPRPQPPTGTPAVVILPPQAADGRFVTINSNLSSAQSVWHLRSALNVAALGCRGADESMLIASYNALLNNEKKQLAGAYTEMRAEFKSRLASSDWETQLDQHMTRLYNFFAQTFAHEAFCKAAVDVAGQVNALSPDALTSFASASVPRLEAPFTDFYVAYVAYRRNLASWEAEYGNDRQTLAAASPPTTAILPLGNAPVGTGTSVTTAQPSPVSTSGASAAAAPAPVSAGPAQPAGPTLPYAPLNTP